MNRGTGVVAAPPPLHRRSAATAVNTASRTIPSRLIVAICCYKCKKSAEKFGGFGKNTYLCRHGSSAIVRHHRDQRPDKVPRGDFGANG